MAGCSGTSAAHVVLPTMGKVGSTLGATGAQYTLDQVIPDAQQKVVVAVLTARNTSTMPPPSSGTSRSRRC